MATLRSRIIRSCMAATALSIALFTVLAPSPAAAELLCRCAYPSLAAVICDNDLTARIRVIARYPSKNGNLYLAEVRRVFRGHEAEGSWIVISAPASCGYELRSGRNYLVSLNVDAEAGHYTTFACGSFVSEWSQLSQEDRATLDAPACSPCDPACEDGQTCVLQEVQCITTPCNPVPACVPAVASQGEVCYRFSETNPELFMERSCADGLKCVNTSEGFSFNSLLTCQPQDWCLNEESAAADCEGLVHPKVLGQWGCTAEHQCAWRAVTGPIWQD
jgi:hypothetical protein